MYLTNTINFNSKMLINLQAALLFHRHSDINRTDKDGIMKIELSKTHILKCWERPDK